MHFSSSPLSLRFPTPIVGQSPQTDTPPFFSALDFLAKNSACKNILLSELTWTPISEVYWKALPVR